MEVGQRLAQLAGHLVADPLALHQAEHPARHRLAVDALGEEERPAHVGRIGADGVDVRHRHPVLLGDQAHARFSGDRIDLDIGRRQDRRHQVQRRVVARGVEQDVAPAGTG